VHFCYKGTFANKNSSLVRRPGAIRSEVEKARWICVMVLNMINMVFVGSHRAGFSSSGRELGKAGWNG
jgi:hypothetical protein